MPSLEKNYFSRTPTTYRAAIGVSCVGAIVFTILVLIVPWEKLQGHEFEDVQNYLAYIDYGAPYLTRMSGLDWGVEKVFGLFFFEALWDFLVFGLASIFGDGQIALKVFTAFVVGVVSFFVLRRCRWYYLLLLINPIFIDFAFSQIRNAVALSLLILTFEVRDKLTLAGSFFAAAMIHTASTIFGSFILASRFIVNHARRIPIHPRLVGVILVLLFVVILTVLKSSILGSFGDRRSDYEIPPVSYSYASIFILFLVVQFFSSIRLWRDPIFISAFLLIGTFTGLTLAGVDGARFLAIGFPFFVVSLSRIPGWTRPMFFVLLIPYVGNQFLYWVH